MQTIFITQDSGGHFVVDQDVVRTIGYLGENGVTEIEFVAPLAFAEWVWTLDFANDVVPLSVLVDDRGTVLVWNIGKTQLAQKELSCNLRAVNGDKTKKTDTMNFLVRSAVDVESIVPHPLPTEFAEAEARMRQILEEIKQATGQSGKTARIGYVTLLADAWTGDESLYAQVVQIDGVTSNTQVDLTPNAEQLLIFHNKDLAFVTENKNGVVTVYAIGQKPQNDYTIQVTMTEVVR